MAFFGKLIGAGLGWTFGGPIGAIIGFGIGWMVDGSKESDIERGYSKSTSGDFAASLLVLIAAVMKADGTVKQSELEYVKKYLVKQFGLENAQEALRLLRDILKQDIPLQSVCTQINQRLDYHSRLELLHILYGIANADGQVHESEVKLIDEIAYYIGLSAQDQASIKNMFYKSNDSAYKILGVSKSSSDDEIKKAYRKLAVEYHPDKVSYLGEEFRKIAEEKFQKINEAYDQIKKERGIK